MWWIATPKLKCWLRVVLFLATSHRKADTRNVREMHLFLWWALTKEWDFFWIWKGKRKEKKSVLSQRAVADFYLAWDKQQSEVRVEKKTCFCVTDKKNSWEMGHPESSRYTTANSHTDIWHNAHTLALMHTHAGTHIHRAASVHHPYENKLFHINHINPLLFLSWPSLISPTTLSSFLSCSMRPIPSFI